MKSQITLGENFSVDLSTLVVSKLLIAANSGGGKSWALRKLLEETHGKIQQVVIDLEGEYYTLRDSFDDYLLIGKGGDMPANLRSASLLATKLLELQASAILDLSELKFHERKQFVRLFLESVMEAPPELYHPCMFVIDEAHHFAPQTGENEALASVIDLMTRGRKRDFCGVLATQRISKLHKDAIAECNNKMFGRTSQDIDMKRTADELGFTTRQDVFSLRQLQPGEFFAFGTAIGGTIEKVKVGMVKTQHQRRGAKVSSPAAPKSAIKAILEKLKDLPQEAEQKSKNEKELKNEIANLKRELTIAKQVKPNPTKIEKIEVPVVGKRALEGLKLSETEMRKMLKVMKAFVSFTADAVNKLTGELAKVQNVPQKTYPVQEVMRPSVTTQVGQPKFVNHEGGLTTPEQRILDAIAWLESIGNNEPEQTAVAFLAGYTYGAGGFNNPKGALRSKGLVSYLAGNKIALTDEGRKIANMPDATLTTSKLHEKVLSILETPHQRILKPLLERYPEAMSDEELAELSGYKCGTGGFNNPKGRLRSLGLIEYLPGRMVKARSILFIE